VFCRILIHFTIPFLFLIQSYQISHFFSMFIWIMILFICELYVFIHDILSTFNFTLLPLKVFLLSFNMDWQLLSQLQLSMIRFLTFTLFLLNRILLIFQKKELINIIGTIQISRFFIWFCFTNHLFRSCKTI